MLTDLYEYAIIEKYQVIGKNTKEYKWELVIKLRLFNSKKTVITNFIFCLKTGQKKVKKTLKKVLTIKKRCSILTKRSTEKIHQSTKKYIEK